MNPTSPWSDLIGILEFELDGLCRLVRLSHRQRRYLVRGDERRVASNVEAIEAQVETLRAAHTERHAILARVGLAGPGGKGLKAAAAAADNPWRERIEALGAALARVTELLGRKNFQNYQLSRFSLDLVGEEMRLLVGASDTPGTTYDADGETGSPASSGAVDGRA